MFTELIWDFDGTLIDTYPGMVEVFSKLLNDQGIIEDEDDILANMKISMGHAYEHYMKKHKLKKDYLQKFIELENSIEPERRPPFPYVVEVCEKVIETGGRNFIVTHREDSTFKYLDHYGMTKYFTEIVTKGYGFKRKPDPEAFIYLIDKYKIDKYSAIGIGDRELDIVAAQNAGIKTCLFDMEAMIHIPADYTISSMKELLEILTTIES